MSTLIIMITLRILPRDIQQGPIVGTMENVTLSEARTTGLFLLLNGSYLVLLPPGAMQSHKSGHIVPPAWPGRKLPSAPGPLPVFTVSAPYKA